MRPWIAYELKLKLEPHDFKDSSTSIYRPSRSTQMIDISMRSVIIPFCHSRACL